MKIYFAKSATADNYICAEFSDGVRCSSCAPDGYFGDVDIHIHGDAESEEKEIERITTGIREMLGDAVQYPFDYEWMGSPCCASMDELFSANDAQELFNQDKFFLVGEYTDAANE